MKELPFFMNKLILVIAVSLITSCAAAPPQKKDAPVKNWVELEKEKITEQDEKPVENGMAPPAFTPVSEELSPLKTKIVSLSVRNQPLKDVLYVIAESTSLNLVIEKGIDAEIPIIVTLKDISAEEALENVLSSVDYFYMVKGNILTIKAMSTRVFEFGQPSIIQEYSVNVGGDILGSGDASESGIKGNVSQKMTSDQTSYKLWESIEKTLSSLLGIGQEAAGAAASGPRFSVNRMTGTIVVTAARKDLDQVDNYLKELKKVLDRQVMIEARIVEVQLSEGLKYGIDWTAIGGDSAVYGTSRFTEVADTLPNFNLNVTSGDLTLLLNALQQQGEVEVLSNPRISIMNGQTALLSVGRKVDFISKVETTTSESTAGSVPTLTFTIETDSILSGIVFGIVPYIESGGKDISLTITPIISDLVSLEDKRVGTVGQNAVQISLPTVDLRELSTTVRVKNEEMVVIGGLIQNKKRVKDNQVPFLARIPIIGNLFKSHDMEEIKTELIVILRPVLISG